MGMPWFSYHSDECVALDVPASFLNALANELPYKSSLVLDYIPLHVTL
jgi:hypothetical protein